MNDQDQPATTCTLVLCLCFAHDVCQKCGSLAREHKSWRPAPGMEESAAAKTARSLESLLVQPLLAHPVPFVQRNARPEVHTSQRLKDKDEAIKVLYEERAQLVIALARAAQAFGCRVGFGLDKSIMYVLHIELSKGKQVSWHLTAEDRNSALDIPDCDYEWDGHSTSLKYERLGLWRPAAKKRRKP